MRRRARPRATRSMRSLDLDTFAGLRPLSARAVAYGAVMAERVSLEGLVYVKRSPTGAYLLTVVTLLVYFFVWYYKINDETRRYLRDDSIRPWHSVSRSSRACCSSSPTSSPSTKPPNGFAWLRNAPEGRSGSGQSWGRCGGS